MWRAAVVAMFVLLAFVQRAEAVAYCGSIAHRIDNTSLGSPLPGYAYKITNADLFVTSPPFNSLAGWQGIWMGSTSLTSFAVGDPCPILQPTFVLMSEADYMTLLNGAEVVAKIQEQMDLGVVGLACVAVAAGFYCGYKMVQRGGSQ